MQFPRTFLIISSGLLLCSSFTYGQKASPPAPVAMTPTPTPAPAPAPAPEYVNITYFLSVAGPFQTFLNYLESTKLIDTFQNQANNTEVGITIFVPKDSSFKGLKKPSLSNLTNDQLESLILFHALPKYYALADFNELSTKSPVSTLAGGQYTLNFTDDSGTVHLDSGWSRTKVSSAVHSTDPVAIYQVDKVLLPEAIFGSDIPPMPAPVPAPVISPAADAPSADSKEGSASSKSLPSSSSSTRLVGLSLSTWSHLVLAISGGLVLLF
ncbi:Fasciclin-like arabinogalactan protein 7 [Hibiscus syriacus]|uniref:Fasciclin-like arabinogalactan protein 7 n=1 Tax=Hibiscus syriacus TaxID=106335 RepID=A0A6A2Z4A1_HIBSY|nr:fasciclin-like arabinogalactan protein 7 [Hibiscus syriacus]XP_039020616.1 fasciclin-like arabinogalactan protein 7 [Hibiscus syriacus]KAE8685912.1 Fasciclin-like arabinogalactan protein 7 [Hibiscus syriacus]